MQRKMKHSMTRRIAVLLAVSTMFSAVPAYGEEVFSETDSANELVKAQADDLMSSTVSSDGAVSSDVADRKEYNGLVYYVDCGECVIVGYKGSDKIVTIPSEIEGHKVKWIGDNAFISNKTIEEIIINEGTEDIRYRAFWGCENLKKVHLPDSLLAIDHETFVNCTKLEEINLPKNLNCFGTSCFSGCSSLKSIVIPQNISEIRDSAFYDCSGLEKITFNSELEDIEDYAFSGCRSLKEIDLGNCEKLEKIEQYAFAYCDSLENFFMSNSIDEIEDHIFYEDIGLKNVQLSINLKDVTCDLFEKCPNLKTVFVSKIAERIGSTFFAENNNVSDIYFDGNSQEWDKFAEKAKERISKAKIHYNTSVAEYLKKFRNGSGENSPSQNSPSDNEPVSSIVHRGNDNEVEISYNSIIPFPGKRMNAGTFGNVTVFFEGKEYKVEKIKVNNKKCKFQILKVSPENYILKHYIKKLTKGVNGLDYQVRAYYVSQDSNVKVKFNKRGRLKSVIVEINGIPYKCKKSEYNYNEGQKLIRFMGDNLTGSYAIINK